MAETLRVAVMNDHASALNVWLAYPHVRRATVYHVDRHSDLASPQDCDATRTPPEDHASWSSCADRAGFQFAAAWLGLVERVWWLKPMADYATHSKWQDGFVYAAPGRSTSSASVLRWSWSAPVSARRRSLAMRVGPLEELIGASEAANTATGSLLDIDIDYWGGAAGPRQPPWEMPSLQRCGALLKSLGSAAWGDERAERATASLWPSLLEPPDAPPPPLSLNASTWQLQQQQCAADLARLPWSVEQRARLRFGRALGLSLPEALVAASAPRGSTHDDECGAPLDEAKLTDVMSRLPIPSVVTIARSIDGFMPWNCVEPTEAAVLRVLQAAFNRSLDVEYLPGCASGASLRALRR